MAMMMLMRMMIIRPKRGYLMVCTNVFCSFFANDLFILFFVPNYFPFTEEDEEDDSEDQDEELQHDNWEAQMLAAELNRRESKRDEPLSSDASEVFDSTSGIRQRMAIRSDTLDTDTENSEIEIDRVQRPRAASFDQQTVRHQRAKGILKALSFDRDKDRL